MPVNALNAPPPSKQGQRQNAPEQPKKKLPDHPTSRKKPAARVPLRKATPLKMPNSDWRNSASRKATKAPKRPEATDFIEEFETPVPDMRETSQPNAVDDMYGDGGFNIDDLGYDDFERAFAELSQGGLNPGGGGSKQSRLVEEHPGLVSGQVIKGGVWPNLIQPDGEPTIYANTETRIGIHLGC